MTYQTIVIDHASKARKMAKAVACKANEMAQVGWELAAFSATSSAKAILVFRVPEAALQEDGARTDAGRKAALPGKTDGAAEETI